MRVKARERRQREEEDKRRQEEDKRRQEEDKRRDEERKQRDEDYKRQKESLDRLDRQTSRNARLMKATFKEVGGISNTLGEIVEHLVAPGLEERFEKLGVKLDLVGPNVKLKEDGKAIAEIDVLLSNAERIIAVEVKSKPQAEDMAAHAARLEKLRGYFDRRGDGRRLMGAIAGAVFSGPAKKAALDAGFYVMAQSGETMKMENPEGFQPKEW